MKYQTSPLIVTALAELGSNLAAARQRRGLSQAALAERAGVSRDTVFRAEQGRAVGTDALAALLHALNALEDLSSLLSLLRDPAGRAIAEQQRPYRVRRSKAVL
jgi:transcriptional regulator with XRE-family HTH domain